MEPGTDTARRDWLLLIAGILAAGWFFYDFGNHHPLTSADASADKSIMVDRGLERLNSLGYAFGDAHSRSYFGVRNSLLDSLQRQTTFNEFYRDSSVQRFFNVYYWETRVQFPEPDSEDFIEDLEIELDGGSSTENLLLRFDQNGNWLEFINPDLRRPVRLLNQEALLSVADVSPELISRASVDSVARQIFSFELIQVDRSTNLIQESSRYQLGRNEIIGIANYYLHQTGWPVDRLSVEDIQLSSGGQLEAAQVTFSGVYESVRQPLQILVTLAPAGALLNLEVSYSAFESQSMGLENIMSGLRGLALLLFFFWLIILLYIRMQLRVIDIRSAILFAVLAGIAFPGFTFLEWLFNNLNSAEPITVMDLMFLFIQMGSIAAFISLGFFIVTVIGESLTRQNWIEKIRTLDLIRIGHFFNLPIGVTLLHSVSFAFILAAFLSTAYWILPGSYISVDSMFMADETYFAPLVQILSLFFIGFLIIQAIYQVLFGLISKWTKNNVIITLSSALIFGVMTPAYFISGPVGQEMLLNAGIGIFLGIIYLYRDFLTVFLTFFIFGALVETADGWVMASSPDQLSFYPLIGLILIFLGAGYLSVTRGKSVRELPKYVPEYIEELAQEERIKQELQIARKVQQSFLPLRKPDIRGLDLAAVCIPAYETGGDYYDFIRLDEDRLAIIIGDVSGKGFQAAFYMTFIKGVLHALCQEYKSTTNVLEKANELFYENVRRGTFISLIFGVVDLKKGLFTFSRAGHNPVFHYKRKENKLHEFKPNGLAIGMTSGGSFSENISEASIELEDEDLLVLFTDGIVEANNSGNDFYGNDRLQRLIYHHQAKNSEEIVDRIIRDVQKFSDGVKQHDDMTIIVMKRK